MGQIEADRWSKQDMNASRRTKIDGRKMAEADNQGIPGSKNVGVVVEVCQKEIVSAAMIDVDGQPLQKQSRTLHKTIQIHSLDHPKQIVQDIELSKKTNIEKSNKGKESSEKWRY